MAAEAVTGPLPLILPQVSVTYPAYPRRDADETEAAHRYRRTPRWAPISTGFLPEGAARRRHLREPHGWITRRRPLSEADSRCRPAGRLGGQPEIMRAAFRRAFEGIAPGHWGDLDVTDIYKAARRHCFEICPRIEIALTPGEAVLVHRLSLHGIAPWTEGQRPRPRGGPSPI